MDVAPFFCLSDHSLVGSAKFATPSNPTPAGQVTWNEERKRKGCGNCQNCETRNVMTVKAPLSPWEGRRQELACRKSKTPSFLPSSGTGAPRTLT